MAAHTLDQGNVADAETENEPVTVERVQRDHGALRGEGIACIDVGDRTSDHQLLAARQQPRRQRHRLVAPRFGVPQGRVAIILDRAHEMAQLRSVEFIGAVPHAKASEFHVDCLRLRGRASRYQATIPRMVRRARATPSDWMSLASWRRRSRSASFFTAIENSQVVTTPSYRSQSLRPIVS